MKYLAIKFTAVNAWRKSIMVSICLLISACATGKLPPGASISMDLDANTADSEASLMLWDQPANLYIFFIRTSEQFTSDNAETAEISLRNHFKDFGEAVGDGNVAVWANEKGAPELSARIGKLLADRYRLYSYSDFSYNDGPYIIVSNVSPVIALRHPFERMTGLHASGQEYFAVGISFNGISEQYVIQAMNYLEEVIRRGQISEVGARRIQFWLDLDTWYSQNKAEANRFLEKVWVLVLGSDGAIESE